MSDAVSAATQETGSEEGMEDAPSYRNWIATLAVGDAVRVRHVLEDRDVPGGRLLAGTVIYRSAEDSGALRLMVRYYDCGCESIKTFGAAGGSATIRLEHPERLTQWQRDENVPQRHEFSAAAQSGALANA